MQRAAVKDFPRGTGLEQVKQRMLENVCPN